MEELLKQSISLGILRKFFKAQEVLKKFIMNSSFIWKFFRILFSEIRLNFYGTPSMEFLRKLLQVLHRKFCNLFGDSPTFFWIVKKIMLNIIMQFFFWLSSAVLLRVFSGIIQAITLVISPLKSLKDCS